MHAHYSILVKGEEFQVYTNSFHHEIQGSNIAHRPCAVLFPEPFCWALKNVILSLGFFFFCFVLDSLPLALQQFGYLAPKPRASSPLPSLHWECKLMPLQLAFVGFCGPHAHTATHLLSQSPSPATKTLEAVEKTHPFAEAMTNPPCTEVSRHRAVWPSHHDTALSPQLHKLNS